MESKLGKERSKGMREYGREIWYNQKIGDPNGDKEWLEEEW